MLSTMRLAVLLLLAVVSVQPARQEPAEFPLVYVAKVDEPRTFHWEQVVELDCSDVRVPAGSPTGFKDEDYYPEHPLEMLSEEREIEFTQTVLATQDGRPVKLRRAWNRAHASRSTNVLEDPRTEDRGEGDSKLAEHSVVFTFADNEWSAEPEGDLVPALCEGLVARADLAGLLPAKRVAIDETWTLPASALDEVVAPGGFLAFIAEETGLELALNEPVPLPGDEPEFEATLRSLKEGLATIDLDGRWKGDVEVRGLGVVYFFTEPYFVPVLHRADVDIEMTGKLVWDLEENRAHGLNAKAELRVFEEVVFSQELWGAWRDAKPYWGEFAREQEDRVQVEQRWTGIVSTELVISD